MLRSLGVEGAVTLPPMLRTVRPAAGSEDQPVPIRIHYMVGNHDWFYHLPGPQYDKLRQALVERLGLANRSDRPFPHDITESDELLQAMRRHKVTARHGDLYDPLSFEGDRDAASLGDAMAIELFGRFVAEAEAILGDALPASTLLELRELDNIRPPLLAAAWLDGLLERTCTAAGPAQTGQNPLGPAGRRVPCRQLCPPASDIIAGWTWSMGWPGRCCSASGCPAAGPARSWAGWIRSAA